MMYRKLAPGKVLVDHGPISMVIEAYKGGRPLSRAASSGAEEAVRQLDKLSRVLDKAKTLSIKLEASRSFPEVLNRMINATKSTGEKDITPMAAVAGAIADMVLKRVLKSGAGRVLVNNGGDIAIRIEPGGSLRVGVVSDLSNGRVTHYIDLKAKDGIGGIATSGLGGRSLTRGIASSVVILAESAAQADACATMVANATTVEHENIILKCAEEIDPLTDIKGQLVVEKVEELDEEAVKKALQEGENKLLDYQAKGLLKGGVIFVKGLTWMFPGGIAQRVSS